MCGECGQNGEKTSCRIASGNGNRDCNLRFLYCLQPYNSTISDPPLTLQRPIPGDSITFDTPYFTQIGAANPNFWNRSNPFTREFQTWPVRAMPTSKILYTD